MCVRHRALNNKLGWIDIEGRRIIGWAIGKRTPYILSMYNIISINGSEFWILTSKFPLSNLKLYIWYYYFFLPKHPTPFTFFLNLETIVQFPYQCSMNVMYFDDAHPHRLERSTTPFAEILLKFSFLHEIYCHSFIVYNFWYILYTAFVLALFFLKFYWLFGALLFAIGNLNVVSDGPRINKKCVLLLYLSA